MKNGTRYTYHRSKGGTTCHRHNHIHPGGWETARAFCTPPLADVHFNCVFPYNSRVRKSKRLKTAFTNGAFFFLLRKSQPCQRCAGQIEQRGLLIALAPLPGPHAKPQISINLPPLVSCDVRRNIPFCTGTAASNHQSYPCGQVGYPSVAVQRGPTRAWNGCMHGA